MKKLLFVILIGLTSQVQASTINAFSPDNTFNFGSFI